MSDIQDATATAGQADLAEYGIEETPPWEEAVPYGLQHLLAMFFSTVAIPLVVIRALGLGPTETTLIIQMVLLVAGLATLVQVFPIGPVGAKLPIVMGTSAIFIGPMISVGSEFGLAAVFGAIIAAAPVEIVGGYFFQHVRRWFPPVVTGTVVMLVGLSLVPVAIDNAAGGVGAENYGAFVNLGLAALVLIVALVLNQLFDGFLKRASILIAVVVGYLVAVPLGMLDLSLVGEVGWFTVPLPLQFGLEFHPGAILVFAFAYVVTAMETIGDISAVTEVVNRDPTPEEFRGGIVADGVMSLVAGVMNAFPNTSYSNPVGILHFTGVASRVVVGITGVFLVVMGLAPKLAAVVASMPAAVLGGAVIILFGLIFTIGVRIVATRSELNRRNLTIVAISIMLGLGVVMRPDFVSQFPEDARILLESGIIVGGVAAVILNAALPRSDQPEIAVPDDAET